MIVGIDCATDPKKVGLALAESSGDRCTLQQVNIADSWDALVQQVAEWLALARGMLLALDAPLGWPADLGPTLAKHRAGEPIGVERNTLFRRETDRFVKEHVGRQPLDVGADRIARTAHAALQLLEEVRGVAGEAIPVAWSHCGLDAPAAIEVYPAGTLTAHGIRAAGYKQRGDQAARDEIIGALESHIDVPEEAVSLIRTNADALDAVVCAVAVQSTR